MVPSAAVKDIQFTFSHLSVQWLIALCGEKAKFHSSLNFSGLSLQLLSDFLLLLFFFFFYKINEVPAIRLLPTQVCRDGDTTPS